MNTVLSLYKSDPNNDEIKELIFTFKEEISDLFVNIESTKNIEKIRKYCHTLKGFFNTEDILNLFEKIKLNSINNAPIEKIKEIYRELRILVSIELLKLE